MASVVSRPAPSHAVVPGCKPGTIFGVGPLGIYEIRPLAIPFSYHRIKALAGGKAISAGFDNESLYVTINNGLHHFDLATRGHGL